MTITVVWVYLGPGAGSPAYGAATGTQLGTKTSSHEGAQVHVTESSGRRGPARLTLTDQATTTPDPYVAAIGGGSVGGTDLVIVELCPDAAAVAAPVVVAGTGSRVGTCPGRTTGPIVAGSGSRIDRRRLMRCPTLPPIVAYAAAGVARVTAEVPTGRATWREGRRRASTTSATVARGQVMASRATGLGPYGFFRSKRISAPSQTTTGS